LLTKPEAVILIMLRRANELESLRKAAGGPKLARAYRASTRRLEAAATLWEPPPNGFAGPHRRG
jgi:hypothetical protein